MILTPVPRTNDQIFRTHMPGRYVTAQEDIYNQGQEWAECYMQHGIKYVVLLCPDNECLEKIHYNLREYYLECQFKVIHFPLVDHMTITKDQNYSNFIDKIYQKYQKGHRIVIHCSAGQERTGEVVESLRQKLNVTTTVLPNRGQRFKWLRNFLRGICKN